jgi:hypothetical protein
MQTFQLYFVRTAGVNPFCIIEVNLGTLSIVRVWNLKKLHVSLLWKDSHFFKILSFSFPQE